MNGKPEAAFLPCERTSCSVRLKQQLSRPFCYSIRTPLLPSSTDDISKSIEPHSQSNSKFDCDSCCSNSTQISFRFQAQQENLLDLSIRVCCFSMSRKSGRSLHRFEGLCDAFHKRSRSKKITRSQCC